MKPAGRCSLRLVLWAALMAVAAGCAPPAGRPEVPGPAAAPCYVGPGPADHGAPVALALDASVNPRHAPLPDNDAERLIFRQLYETLVRIDCEGEVVPGLAEGWRSTEDGRIWTFTLRAGARFWDGVPIWPQAVSAAWRRTRGMHASGSASLPWIWIRPESVSVSGDREVRVALTAPLGESPALFAHPALAVAKPSEDSAWPMGTGPYRPGDASGYDLALLPVTTGRSEPALSVIRVGIHPGADPRDVFTPKVDLMLLRDRGAVDYASSLPGYVMRELPFDRLYVLVSPVRTGEGGTAFDPSGSGSPPASGKLGEELARDVAVSAAQGAAGFSFAGSGGAPCPATPPAPAPRTVWPSAPLSNRVVYPSGDTDAERLAERVVALGSASKETGGGAGAAAALEALGREGGGPRAEALTGVQFREQLASGSDIAYVVPLVRAFAPPCREARALVADAPWLRCLAGGCTSGSPYRLGLAALPLVRTRPQAAVRRTLAGLRVDGDGTLLLDRLGWSADAEEVVP